MAARDQPSVTRSNIIGNGQDNRGKTGQRMRQSGAWASYNVEFRTAGCRFRVCSSLPQKKWVVQWLVWQVARPSASVAHSRPSNDGKHALGRFLEGW
jgi:hypothetical protein